MLLTDFLLGLEMNKYLILSINNGDDFFIRLAFRVGANSNDYSSNYITFSRSS